MDKPNFSSKQEFEQFLKNTLIPDLRRSGTDATADDFEEALYWMSDKRKKHYRVKMKGTIGVAHVFAFTEEEAVEAAQMKDDWVTDEQYVGSETFEAEEI